MNGGHGSTLRINPVHELLIAHALVVENDKRKAQKLRERFDKEAGRV